MGAIGNKGGPGGARPGAGRHFRTNTPLGKLMLARSVSVKLVSESTGIHDRDLNDYLAGRRPITVGHLARLARAFQVDPTEIDPSYGA